MFWVVFGYEISPFHIFENVSSGFGWVGLRCSMGSSLGEFLVMFFSYGVVVLSSLEGGFNIYTYVSPARYGGYP